MRKHGPLVLLLCSGAAAVVLGFVAVTPARGLELAKHWGCWLILAAFLLFVWALAHVIRRAPREWCRDRREWLALLSIPAGCAMLLPHEPRGFKIIMDEIMLLGTSMSMHFNRLVEVPMRGNDLHGAFELVDGIVDKRPFFFPFLLSVVHDVTGYRPENAFLLNALLAVALLVVVYVLGRTLAGRPAAVASVLLLGGLPLLAQNATGGGFDLLNLLMITLVLWLAVRLAETRDQVELTALLFGLTLLAQTRYESAFYFIPAGLVVLWVWRKERRVVLSWPAAVAPLLLLPVPWIFGVFTQRPDSWEMASQVNQGSPLALAYVGENLSHARAFFFATIATQSNSLLFSILGTMGIAGLFVWLGWKIIRRGETPPAVGVAVVFAGALLVHVAFLMAYFWGKFDDPVISRLSLPAHLLFLLSLWVVVPRGRSGRWTWIAVSALALAQFWRLSLPAMASHAYTLQNVHTREVEWRRAFIAARPQKDFLVIDPYSPVWITHQVPATWPLQARQHPEAIAYLLRIHSFHDFFVFQRFEIDPATGRETLIPEFDLGPDYVLEPVSERRLQPYTLSRISRVVAVNAGEGRTLPAKK